MHHRRHRARAARLTAAVLLTTTPLLHATTYNWIATSGDFSTSTNWSPTGTPGQDDQAIISTNDAVDRAITFSNPTPGPTLQSLRLDALSTGTTTLTLANSDPLYVKGLVVVGLNGSASVTQSAGEVSGNGSPFGPTIYLGAATGSTGTWSMTGGSINAYQVLIADEGTGHFTQSAGSVASTGAQLLLAQRATASATYTLNDGSLTSGNAHIGLAGHAEFTQTGGTHSVSQTLSLALASTATASYRMEGGTLTAAANGGLNAGINIGVASPPFGTGGSADFTQTAGTVNAGDVVAVGPTSSLSVSGGTFITHLGTNGGSVTSAGSINVSATGSLTTGQLTSSGSVIVTGGTLHTTALHNSGDVTLTDGLLSATFLLNNNSLTVTGGNVQGTVSNAASATFASPTPLAVSASIYTNGTLAIATPDFTAGELNNDGAYTVLLPGTHRYSSATFGPSSSLSAPATGFTLTVETSATLAATNPATWDTTNATLEFAPSTILHDLLIAAPDQGPTPEAYANNFAWHTLRLAPTDSLTLNDASPDLEGGALYTRVLDLQGGLAQIASITGNGLNLYYDPAFPENAYLAGGTYPLTNGGSIIAIPEPTTLSLLGTVFILATRRRRPNQGTAPTQPRC